MHNFPINDGENRADLLDLGVGHGKVVFVEHGDVGQFTGLDGTDLVFHAQKPAIPTSKKTKGFLPGDLLVAVDARAKRIYSGRCKVDLKPRIQWRDVNAVAVNPDLDAVIHDRSEWRAGHDFGVG